MKLHTVSEAPAGNVGVQIHHIAPVAEGGVDDQPAGCGGYQ